MISCVKENWEFFEYELTDFYELQSLLNQNTLIRDVVDRAVWMHHSSGDYEVKSFLNLMLHPQQNYQDMFTYANVVWKSLTPPKSELLLWFLLLGKLNTKDRLIRFNIRQGLDSKCVLCNQEEESINHLFCCCPFTWRVWCTFLNWWDIYPRSAFDSWLGFNGTKAQKRCWVAWFYVIVWTVWETRNRIIFQQHSISWEKFMVNLIHRGDLWVKNWRGTVPNLPPAFSNF